MAAALALISTGHALQRAGVIAVAALAAGALIAAPASPAATAVAAAAALRLRAVSMLAALVLTPVLLLSDIWDSPQVHPLRDHPVRGAAAIVAVLAIVAALAAVIRRRPQSFPLLAVAALPFRIPISSGGTTSNLLVPLYLVVAAGVVVHVAATLGRARDADAAADPPVGGLERLLGLAVVLYAVQATYSGDFSKALEQVVFFYVPFALLYVLLRRVRWDARTLLRCLAVATVLAVVFVAIGYVEYHRRRLLLNPKVIAANQVESYFRVNSLFFDPNIYGRFLALVMIALSGALLHARNANQAYVFGGLLAFLWGGLVLSFSQSSIAALLLGLGILAAVRLGLRPTLTASGIAVLLGVALVIAAPNTLHVHLSSSQSADNSTSGRYTLVKGGLDLFAQRPLQGFGSAAFAKQYLKREKGSDTSAVSASHTIPITVSAEQGLVGLAVYLALLWSALRVLFAGFARSRSRTVVAALFAALVLHTMLYASFLEDPLTWTLLALGSALALLEDPPAASAGAIRPANAA